MNTDQNQLINTDASKKGELIFEDLTYKIRGAIFNVANKYGKGLKEQIYQKALAFYIHQRSQATVHSQSDSC